MRARKLMTMALLSIMITCLVLAFAACEQEEGHKHEYSLEWTYDEDYHWHKATCEHTEEIKDKEEHSWGKVEIVNEPTHDNEGLKIYTCSICSAVKEEIIPQKHNYELKEVWEKDENYHWHNLICVDCGDKKEQDKDKHSWDSGEIIEDATCTNTGIIKYTCSICNAIKEEIIPQKHNYELKEVWEKDENYHWHELICVGCGDKKEQDKSEHSWDNGEIIEYATCAKEGAIQYTCKVCEQRRTESIPIKEHIYSTRWSKDETYHWRASICGHEVEKDKEEHSWDSYDTCKKCNYDNSDGIKFKINIEKTEYTVVGIKSDNRNSEIIIPSEYKSLPVTSIDTYAFYNCSSLTNIEIPSSVTSIGDHAFAGCSSIISIEIPSSVTSIGNYAFSGCSGLTSVEIPNSVTSISGYAFSNCSNIKIAIIPTIAIGCIPKSKLEKVIINGGESIRSSAFSDCSRLTSIEMPSSVTSIGNNAFNGCSGLTGVYITDIASWCAINFGDFFSNPLYYAYNLYLSNELVTELVIPSSVTSIGDRAFYNCSSLTSIEIPSSVTSIGDSAFFGCSSLTSVTFEDNSQLTSIGSAAFVDCSNLTSIEIPSSVTSIGDSAFSRCSNLTSIEISSSVISIGDSAFSYCSSLISIEIPSSVTSIGSAAFKGCSGLTSVTFEDNSQLTSIGSVAFVDCSNLTSIEIPSSVTSIGDSAFYRCSNLTSIEIPSSVTSIGDSAFSYCSSLISIEIPSSVTSIGSAAFKGCSGLTSVTFEDNSQLTSIGSVAFVDCSNLTSIEIPSSVTSIGDSAFYNCSNLTSIEIPSSVTSIGDSAFYNCSNLTSIEIPSSVTSIGSSAFSGCSSLTIYCEAESQPGGWNSSWNISDRPVVWGYKG